MGAKVARSSPRAPLRSARGLPRTRRALSIEMPTRDPTDVDRHTTQTKEARVPMRRSVGHSPPTWAINASGRLEVSTPRLEVVRG